MIRDLGRALSEAISDSSEVVRSLQKIRDEGYSLYLLVDGTSKGREPQQVALEARGGPPETAPPPRFLINGQDLSFLKGIGIDPTRRLRRRRSD